MRVKLKLQGNVITDTGAQTLAALSVPKLYEYYQVLCIWDTGAGGSGKIHGHFTSLDVPSMNKANGESFFVDTEATASLEMTVQFSVASTGNSLSCIICSIEVLPPP